MKKWQKSQQGAGEKDKGGKRERDTPIFFTYFSNFFIFLATTWYVKKKNIRYIIKLENFAHNFKCKWIRNTILRMIATAADEEKGFQLFNILEA